MKNTGMKLSDFSPRVRAQIEAQLKGQKSEVAPMYQRASFAAAGVIGAQAAVIGSVAKAQMVRQDRAGLNKTEREWLEYLKATMLGKNVRVQEVTLKLANGVRYTPDFVVRDPIIYENGRQTLFTAFEVKGFMRDDASAKIKFAAKEWREDFTFVLVWKRNRKQGGGWATQTIIPPAE